MSTPSSIERVEKRVAKFRQSRAQLLDEINKAELEMDYPKIPLTHEDKTKVNLLRDIPELVWRRILSLYHVEENDLWSLSLASPELEKRFNRDGPAFKKSCVMKKVMAVLTRNHYLNRNDLLNCLNSGSPGLEDAAAQGWRYLKNKVSGTIVKFNDSGAILKYMEDVSQQRNIWTFFIGRQFEFNTNNLQTFNDHENYLTAMKEFLRKYGRFVFFIEMTNILWTDEHDRINFLKRLLHTMPNIQNFQQIHNFAKPILSTSFDSTNKEPSIKKGTLFNISGISLLPYPTHVNPALLFFWSAPKRDATSSFKVEDGIEDHSSYKMFGPQCHTWHLDFCDFVQLQLVSPRTENYCKNVKVLEIKADGFSLAHYEIFLKTDFTRFISLKQLILHGGQDHLNLVERFPQVREVTLHNALRMGEEQLNQPPCCTLPFIKKFTLVFYHHETIPLGEIAKVLPLLRHFCLRTKITAFEMQTTLKELKDRGTFQNDSIDVYNLYAEGEPLNGSNIWQHMENLNTLVVESVAQVLEWEPFPGKRRRHGGYTKRNELYSRNKGNIGRRQETVLDDDWRIFDKNIFIGQGII